MSEVDGVMQGNVEGLEEKRYILKGGILYQCRGQSETLILPECLGYTAVELGHSIPWGVHYFRKPWIGLAVALHRQAFTHRFLSSNVRSVRLPLDSRLSRPC